MRLSIALLIAVSCFGQVKNEVWPAGSAVDASAGKLRPPEKTYVQLQALTPSTWVGYRFTVTDCLAIDCTTGGGDGSFNADFRSNGSVWVKVSGGGGGGGAATSVAQLTDMLVTIATSTVLSIPATNFNIRITDVTYTFNSTATFTLSSGSGTAFVYIDSSGSLVVGHNVTGTCVNCGAISAVTAFPAGSIPIAQCVATSGTWATCVDKRAFLSSGGNSSGSSASISCTPYTVTSTDLAGLATAPTGEISLRTSVPVATRYDQVLMSETVQFTGPVGMSGLTVSMGRPGTSTHDEMSGATMALMQSSGDVNFWSSRPIPPQVGGSPYNVVLNFALPIYYNAGTADAVNGSTSITGHGTTWTSTMEGMYIALSGVYYKFHYLSATTGCLGTACSGGGSTPYAGTTASGLGNVYVQFFPKQVTGGTVTGEICSYAAH